MNGTGLDGYDLEDLISNRVTQFPLIIDDFRHEWMDTIVS